MDGRGDDSLGRDPAQLGEQGVFEVRVTAALADAHALAVHGHAAAHDQIDGQHVLEGGRHTVARSALDAGGVQ
jgi:hypothetical protein